MRRIITVITIITIIIFIFYGWWNSQSSPVSGDKAVKNFVIPKGVGVSEIAKKLKQEGLIKSELFFKFYISQNNLAGKIQAGSFKLSPSMSVAEITKNLQSGSEDIWITFIEGWRIEEFADKLNQELKIDKSKFLKLSKEGYMFPDTYLFPKEATVEYIVDTLRKTFDLRFNEDLRQKVRSKGLTEKEAVILASLVEREGRSDKVRREVASILLKRINIGMKLDVDATVQYALGFQEDEKSWWKRHITKEDKEIKSSFNTYTNRDLPPSPICNPSLSSLQAVADADAATPYLYYYHDSKGNSHYATDLDEHNANVANNP
ncbi:MAG: Uncharacterized protein G01um10147_585 [Microgenomates group bacterium Gr01-1014_7]|nr:MAG: Uncharacterized protein G01um10147_585 [Microgenomates group bacterium Gr01-1014_7]